MTASDAQPSSSPSPAEAAAPAGSASTPAATPTQQPAEATFADLNEAEVDWVKTNLDWLTEAGWDGTADSLGQIHDLFGKAWDATDELARPDANDLVNAVGIGLGDLLARRLGYRWQVYTDAHGSSLAVHGGPHEVTLFPIATVARCWEDGERGWIPGWIDQICAQISALGR